MTKIPCYYCGIELKSDSPIVQCGMCTQKKLKWLDRLESESGIRIANAKDFASALSIRENDEKIGVKPFARIPFLRPETGCEGREYVTPTVPIGKRLKMAHKAYKEKP